MLSNVMSPRLRALCLVLSVIPSMFLVDSALAQETEPARLVADITADTPADGGSLALDDVSSFDPSGGDVEIDPDTSASEVLSYEGVSTETNELTGITRARPLPHAEGAVVVPMEQTSPSGSPSPSPSESSASDPNDAELSSSPEPSPTDDVSSSTTDGTSSEAEDTNPLCDSTQLGLCGEGLPPVAIVFDDDLVAAGPEPDVGVTLWFTAYNALGQPAVGWEYKATAIPTLPLEDIPIYFRNTDSQGRGFVTWWTPSNWFLRPVEVTFIATMSINPAATATAARIWTPVGCDPECEILPSPCELDPDCVPSVPPQTPKTSLQIWDVNMHNLFDNGWQGMVTRMVANQFAPDLILLQEVEQCNVGGSGTFDFLEFRQALNAAFGITFDFVHSGGASDCTGDDTSVLWNTSRLELAGTSQTWTTSICALATKNIAVPLRDKKDGRDVVAASLHIGAAGWCLGTALSETNTVLEGLRDSESVTIVGGDFNERPDKHGETAANGLETDPDCWYRGFSPAHDNQTLPLESTPCSSSSDRYYDAAWLYAGSGGATNPTATSMCQQFTKAYEIAPLDTNIEAANSCTDVNGGAIAGPDGTLDRSRIDYIWFSWEKADGSSWTPPAQVAASYVQYASADLGLDLTSANRYSDHRAVQTLLTWPPAMSP